MKLKTLILHFLILVFFLHPSFCRGTEIPAHSTSTKIEQIFKQSDYDNYLLPPEYRYPPLFVSSWPQDFNDIKSPQQQHKFFLMILLPLALDINRSLSQERQVIIYLDHKRRTDSLDSSDKQIIEDLSAKYDFFTRLPPPLRYESQLKELLLRVDSIPPSIFLAAAAINTNWGEAKFLAPSNNLYRELLWYTDEGLKPQDETQDNSYRIKIYPSLHASMQDYALKLNSSVNYTEFREARANLRYRDQYLDGRFLAPYLIFDSALPNYAGLLDYTITFYRLNELDKHAKISNSADISTTASKTVTKN